MSSFLTQTLVGLASRGNDIRYLIIPLYIKYMCFHNVPGTRDIVINTKFLGSKNLSFQVAIIAR